MDTFILNAICQELQPRLCPSTINAFVQPEEYSLVCVLWQQGTESRLAMSVDARYQYLFLTDKKPVTSQAQGDPFAKFLQHHIRGGRIRDIRKPPLERVLTVDIVKQDIDGQDLRFQLILELMGRYSNIILVNVDTNKILESIRHVTAVHSSYRRIAPGAVYVPPPPQQEKLALTAIDRPTFQQILEDYAQAVQETPKLRLWKFLIQRIGGLSPLLAREVDGRHLDQNDEARWTRFSRIVEAVKTGSYQPTVVLEQTDQGMEKPLALSAIPLEQFSY
ncbi:hypothetical protein GF339_11555, partial [candidate division KSB3 bacterium]|nr:hypothetical protein [candidate division KSB3 bacterium]MBD3325213.1 hypothetical protein [candidate division KSB3 bacterium]